MRVAFNATSLLSPLTGIGRYSLHIAEGLISTAGIDVEFFYGANWSTRVRTAPLPGAGSLLPWLRGHLPFSYELRRLVQSNRFSAGTAGKNIDLYHEPNFLPLPFDGPTITTVHDLSWIRYPEAHPIERVRAMNRYFPAGLERSSLVLTDSSFVKNELVDVFGVKEERICVIPLGVDSLFSPRSSEDTQDTLTRWNLKHGRYFLAVGTMEPRKNLGSALDAHERLPASIRQQCPLVLSGMKGWNSSTLEERIRKMGKDRTLLNVGYIARADLAVLVSGANALVFPSIYEGFGLPLLEAMACGVPAISSNAASMPEVLGNAGVLLDPQDIEGMTLAMHRFATNSSERDEFAKKALDRSHSFSWSMCTRSTIEAYRRVVAHDQYIDHVESDKAKSP